MIGSYTGVHKHTIQSVFAFVVLIAVMVIAPVLTTPARAQDATTLPDLESGRRVYDETGTSLTPEQDAALERQLSDLMAVGADAVVVVRALDATPEETLEQVEALQQAWVAETGADQDTAVAILINRNPDDPNDAWAGIYVGSTFDDGNVPRDEQEAIVSEELIPPLRQGNVYGSVAAGIDRLESSIRNGPPKSTFEDWSSDAGSSWFPWAGVGAALAGLVIAFALFRNRQTTTLPDQEPTTTRPGNLTPALAGALALGSPQASAVPATLLDLAGRDAVEIEPESEGGAFSKPKVRLRLVDRGPVRDEVEATLWVMLKSRAQNGVVSSKDLTKVAGSSAVRMVVESQMRAAGWLDAGAVRAKAGLMMICLVAVFLALFSLVVAGAGGQWLPVVGFVASAALAAIAWGLYSRYSGLTRSGQEAAIPWKAYRKGLQHAAKDAATPLDLDAVLADTVAMNLGSAMDDRLKAADESGQVLRAFASRTNSAQGVSSWTTYGSIATMTSGAGSAIGTVSGGGAGGGGGAAGST
jgi:uncharacterized membrane protein YgcG